MERIVNLHIEKLPEGMYLATSDAIQGLVAKGRTIQETIDIARDVAVKILEAKQERDVSPRCPLLAMNSIIRSCCSLIIHGISGSCSNSDYIHRRPEHKTG